MDLLAHAMYGATVCSKTGLAGGRLCTRRTKHYHWATDWTVWCGLIMGLLPDVIALGPPWVAYLLNGREGNYWLSIGEDDLARYRYTHSLILSLGGAGLLRLMWKPLFAPALAWPLHVAMDALTHGTGRFQTPIFYPLSTWGLDSIRWWEHPGLMISYWLALPAIWVSLWLWRRPADKHVGV